jgi:hypothetical protein
MRKLRRRIRLLIGLLLVVLLVGSIATVPVFGQGQGNPPGLARAMEVQGRHTGALMSLPDVIGTAVTTAVDGQFAVMIMTRQGGTPGLPAQLEDVPVVVVATGQIVALSPNAQVDRTARFPRPVPIGVSTGHPSITAGTIGARVTAGGQVFALSNNHVYAASNSASLGDPVIQPGSFDGGTVPNDVIGNLYAFAPIVMSTSANNEIDAAIALTTPDLVGTSTPPDGYGTPQSTTVQASLGMSVQKYGRTTGRTFGQVDAINATVNVCFASPCQRPGNTARFVNQIVITPGTFSAGGDSGSLIVNDNRNPVGLLFAGSTSHTIANPINAVLTYFGVQIDSSTEPPPPPNNPPSVTITSPTDGSTFNEEASIPFTGTASDVEDGDLTASLVWTSSLDGQIGTGGRFSAELSVGTHTVTASVTDSGGLTGSASITVTVQADQPPPPPGVTVTAIDPNSVNAGQSVNVTITGTGFASGATVALQNGSGPTPQVSNVVVVDSNTITATISTSSAGPPRNRIWDVRVTNPDSTTGVLVGGFTVTA